MSETRGRRPATARTARAGALVTSAGAGFVLPGGRVPRVPELARQRWEAELAQARGEPGAGGHANRQPEDLTWRDWQQAQALARTLYPGKRLSEDGTAQSERHLRRALAIAHILDNPQLAPLTNAQAEAAPDLAAVAPVAPVRRSSGRLCTP